MPYFTDKVIGNTIGATCLIIPLLGCALAVWTGNMGWLFMLVPLIVFMEGAFLLIPLAWWIVALILGR